MFSSGETFLNDSTKPWLAFAMADVELSRSHAQDRAALFASVMAGVNEIMTAVSNA